jgi:2-polyprenyl-6-methoxyphenol hydroxylase-like FAD-dependent oxidoreductase
VQPLRIACQNWTILWRALRAKVPDACYHADTPVTSVQAGNPEPVLTLAAGRDRFDVVIGADGYQSTVRPVITPGATLVPSGYGLWRGICPEDRLSAPALGALEKNFSTVVFPGGHGNAYLIPDASRPGKRLLNWGVYIVPPTRFIDLRLIPPGAVDDRLFGLLENVLARHFPALWANAIRLTGRDHVSVQPICDVTTPAYAHRRLVLAGDAGAVARPHTGSGATMALLDALALERWHRTAADWDTALDGYHLERGTAGNAQTELGRALGRAQVTGTPDWNSMSPADFDRWWSAFSASPDLIYR